MSEVASVAGSGSTPGPEGELDLPAHMPNVSVVAVNSESNGGHSSSVSQHRLSPNSLLPAPTVRVEELRDDGGTNFVASDHEEVSDSPDCVTLATNIVYYSTRSA